MTEKAFIQKLIDINQPMETSPTRYSTLALLLRGGRRLSGYNIKTGIYKQLEFYDENFLDQTFHSFQFTGLINYLIFLEQIGSLFQPKKSDKNPSDKTNGINCALSYFSVLDDQKIAAIRALRNSLTHKFGLATQDKADKSFKFSLSTERNSDIIHLGEWAGDFSDKNEKSLTTVFIFDFIDLVEMIYKDINQGWAAQTIDCMTPLNEINARYTMVY